MLEVYISLTIFVLFFILGVILMFINFKPVYALYWIDDHILTRLVDFKPVYALYWIDDLTLIRLVGFVLSLASGFKVYLIYLNHIVK